MMLNIGECVLLTSEYVHHHQERWYRQAEPQSGGLAVEQQACHGEVVIVCSNGDQQVQEELAAMVVHQGSGIHYPCINSI